MKSLGFPCGSAGKESACNAGDLGSIPGLGRSPGEGKGYPLQYSGLENSMDYTVLGVVKSPIALPAAHGTELLQDLASEIPCGFHNIQDGGVEGRVVIFSSKNFKIEARC